MFLGHNYLHLAETSSTYEVNCVSEHSFYHKEKNSKLLAGKFDYKDKWTGRHHKIDSASDPEWIGRH